MVAVECLDWTSTQLNTAYNLTADDIRATSWRNLWLVNIRLGTAQVSPPKLAWSFGCRLQVVCALCGDALWSRPRRSVGLFALTVCGTLRL